MGGKRLARSPRGKGKRAVLLLLLLLCLAAGALVFGRKFLSDSAEQPAPSSAGATENPSPLPDISAGPAEEPSPPTPLEELLDGMALREKICQMLLVPPSAITGVSRVVAAGEQTRQALERYPVGGLIYDASNLVSQEQVQEMLSRTQGYTAIPLLLTCDEEGGRVGRLMSKIGTTRVEAMFRYKDQGPETARKNAHTIASDMSGLGFNLDLAPVADVWTNPQNTVIGDRAYSDSFGQAAGLIPAAVAGFHDGGVACVLKHFPGHGGTDGDTHLGAAYVDKSLDELRESELLPFQAGIDAGADAVMMGHLIVTPFGEEPVVFSEALVTGLLREEMGFDGVVMTDALNMKAISEEYSSAEVAVRAVQAGVDILLSPMDIDETIDALTQAVEEGTLSPSRIDESVLRILQLKESRGMLRLMGDEVSPAGN